MNLRRHHRVSNTNDEYTNGSYLADAEARVEELERVLTDLLDCFNETPEGIQAETADDGITLLSDDVAEAVAVARDILYRGEDDAD